MDDLGSILKDFSRLVDKFCDSAEASQKYNENLAQKFIAVSKETELHFEKLAASEQKHTEELLRQERRLREQTEHRRRRESFLIAVIGSLGAVLTALFAYMWHIESRKFEMKKMYVTQQFHKEQAIQDEIQHLRNKIKSDYALRDELMEAMASFRGIRDYGQQYCVDGKYAGKDPMEYQQNLFKSEYNLLGSLYKTRGIFNDALNTQIVNFLALTSVDKNVCAKDAAKDKDLQPLQHNINDSMEKFIQNIQKNEDALKNILRQDINRNIS